MDEVLSTRHLELFSERIANDLETEPLDLPAKKHRVRLADLMSWLGGQNHYEFLSIEPQARDDEVHAAYLRLARVTHPLHARHLGLRGMEGVLKVLFEQATEAYLVLSDPLRRSSYNLVAGVKVDIEVDQAQREDEKRKLARQNYRLALHYMSDMLMDYSRAVDLLKEATRLDPRPEYYTLLGQALSKNPNWLAQALGSYRRAVELSPDDAGIRVGYGNLLERMGEPEGAKAQYLEALKTMPDHPEAQMALERLGGKVSDGLRSLFGGRFKKQ